MKPLEEMTYLELKAYIEQQIGILRARDEDCNTKIKTQAARNWHESGKFLAKCLREMPYES